MIRFRPDTPNTTRVDDSSGDGRLPGRTRDESSLGLSASKVSVESWLGKHLCATLAIGFSFGVMLGWLIKRQK